MNAKPIPRVSVVIPCYNSACSVRRAIDSVLIQTCQDFELIVVDDASTDQTAAILQQSMAADPRIRIILNERNSGPGAARNRGINASRGQWIAFLDSDDWYEPERLEKLLGEAERDGAKLVADNQYFVQANAEQPFYLLRPRTTSYSQRLTPQNLLDGDRWGRMTNLGLLKPILNRKFFEASDIRFDEDSTAGEDFYFLLKCMERARYVLFVTEPLYNYQIRNGSLSNSPSLDTMISILKMHNRCVEQLQDRVGTSMLKLMDKRAIDLKNVIRYKRLVEPMKALDIGKCVKQLMTDPGVLPITSRLVLLHLVRSLARAPWLWRSFRTDKSWRPVATGNLEQPNPSGETYTI